MFGVSLAMLVGADLGLDPWDVLHQGHFVGGGVGIRPTTFGAMRRQPDALNEGSGGRVRA